MTGENFSDHPRSLAEVRSDRSGSASDWTPRDALISVLRRIDAGEIAPDALVIAFADLGNMRGPVETFATAASPNVLVTMGLLDRARAVLVGEV